MHNTFLLMQILQRLGHLRYDVTREVFAEVGEPHDLVEQFATWCKLQYDVVVLFRFGEVDELDDVGVIKLAHDLNLLENVRSL